MTEAYCLGKMLFYLLLILCAAVMICFYRRSKRPVLSAFKGMLSGGISLAVLHFFGGALGIYLPVSIFSVTVSLVFGTPGVIITALACKHGLL